MPKPQAPEPRTGQTDYRQALSLHQQSLEALATGSVEISSQIVRDAVQVLDDLSYDLADDSQPKFEQMLETIRFRLEINLEYRKSYADDIFGKGSRHFSRYLSPTDQHVLANLRNMARELGPDHSRIRSLTGFSYPTQPQTIMSVVLDEEVWRSLQETAGKLGPQHPKIRSILTAASTTRAAIAMSVAFDERVWHSLQGAADELGPDHPRLRSIFAAASTPESRAAMSVALDYKVWLNLQDVAKELGSVHHRVRYILGAASTPAVADVMLGLLYRQSDSRPLSLTATKFFAERTKKYIERVTRTAADNDVRAEWLTREDPNSIESVIKAVRQIRQDARAEGREVADSTVYLALYRDADYADGQESGEVQVDRTRPFQIVAALMGGSRDGRLPF